MIAELPAIIESKNLFWLDDIARDGSENMAIDEYIHRYLLEEQLIIRCYRWRQKTTSYGYFSSEPKVGNQAIVKRWTGGGIVEHGDDLTYSLFIPSSHILASHKGLNLYLAIHQIIASVLQQNGIAASVVDKSKPAHDYCFQTAQQYDIIDISGNKIAGAGQRKCKHGILHQGSIQKIGWHRGVINSLIEQLLAKQVTFSPTAWQQEDKWQQIYQKYAK